MTYILIFLLQVFFNILKVLEIRHAVHGKVKESLINSVLISSMTLASSYFSLDELFSGNWIVILFFVGGSVVGKWLTLSFLTK
jgi:hypothetical protein